MTNPTITAYDWVPDFARGYVRDLRVRWALEEVGQPYEVRYLSQGSQKQPSHRAIQPFGQVPTYEEDDLTLFESGAIVLHIAARHPRLMPTAPQARARVYEWAFAALNTVEPPIADLAIATLFEADQPWSKPRLPAVKERIDERIGDLSLRLGEREWLDGDFSAGDLLMVSVLRDLTDSGMLATYPNLAAYVARGEARPAFQKALADQLAGFTGEAPPQFAEWLEKMKTAQAALQGEKA
ncbi:glutathione S-transferase family protein [Sphingomonas sp. LY29]|uniref:glutathione S-transferase family protein n=1 Tax=Sphingomonas sp. LY29 TaxID=3095341 RepID=UPI002D7873B9|nr:glutathione S-transferase family protein [Sphingomonas sp. LY29]WRP24719.1 glutathione S-transferase family protein [Sphingomonas sp. LY29]